MWFTVHIWPPNKGYTQPIDHWVASVDVAALFRPAPVLLPVTAGGQAMLQAERTTTVSTQRRPPGPDGVIPVDATAHMLLCTGACANDGVPGEGFMLGDSTAAGHQTGAVEYQVYAPAAGTYRVAYRVRGQANPTNPNPAIELRVDATVQSTPVDTAGAWQTVTGPAIQLHAGLNTLQLSPPAGGGNWYLNWYTLTRA
jgi:hypothetical protein